MLTGVLVHLEQQALLVHPELRAEAASLDPAEALEQVALQVHRACLAALEQVDPPDLRVVRELLV